LVWDVCRGPSDHDDVQRVHAECCERLGCPVGSFAVCIEQTEPRANVSAADKDNAALFDDWEGHTRIERDSTEHPDE
jgi:hypothetical protein